MNIGLRKFVDRLFGSIGVLATLTLIFLVILLLGPIITYGLKAFIFYGTIEYRQVMLEQFGRGNRLQIETEVEKTHRLREPIYRIIAEFEQGIVVEPQAERARKAYRAYKNIFSSSDRQSEEIKKDLEEAKALRDLFISALESRNRKTALGLINDLLSRKGSRPRFQNTPMNEIWDMAEVFRRAALKLDFSRREEYRTHLESLKEGLRKLYGPFPDEPTPTLLRTQYGQTRWNRVEETLHDLLYLEKYVYNEQKQGRRIMEPRKSLFLGTPIAKVFAYFEDEGFIRSTLQPRLTFYGRFLTDSSKDAHFFGGIWPELLGTCYLTFLCMILVIPIGVIAAIYLAEYAKENHFIKLIRTCINTLAAVPSIVFGLFGLAFFINTIHLSGGKSVLVGSATLALLVLPVIIRTAEEAIKAVPKSQKEASLALGAGLWRTILLVILPQAMPGILTGIIIGLGRAAGETAPIIFTAAVSVGSALRPWQTLSNPTPTLSFNLYNLCTEHEAVEQIRHVQYGMALSLVALVLVMNGLAMYLRARFMKKLRRT